MYTIKHFNIVIIWYCNSSTLFVVQINLIWSSCIVCL